MKYLLFITVLLLASCSKEKVQVYLIPEGYEGPIVLIEDKNSQKQIVIENDTIIFDFTKSNILRFNNHFLSNQASLSNINYYYVDDNENRVKIPILIGNQSATEKNTVFVQLMHTQVREGSQCELICSPNTLNRYIHLQMELCDSLFAIRPSNK